MNTCVCVFVFVLKDASMNKCMSTCVGICVCIHVCVCFYLSLSTYLLLALRLALMLLLLPAPAAGAPDVTAAATYKTKGAPRRPTPLQGRAPGEPGRNARNIHALVLMYIQI